MGVVSLAVLDYLLQKSLKKAYQMLQHAFKEDAMSSGQMNVILGTHRHHLLDTMKT